MPNDVFRIAGVVVACGLAMILGAALAFVFKHFRHKKAKASEAVKSRAVIIQRYLRAFPQLFPDLNLSQLKVLEETMQVALEHIQNPDNDLSDVRLAVANIEKRLHDFGLDGGQYYLVHQFFYELLLARDKHLAEEFAEHHPAVLEEKGLGKETLFGGD